MSVSIPGRGLGRKTPTTDEHVRLHPLRIEAVTAVENVVPLPWWHWYHNQFDQGACVGHGTAMERAVREQFERRQAGTRPHAVRFDAWWLWDQAKLADEWDDTNPGDDNGTSVHAAYDVVRHRGAVKVSYSRSSPAYPGPRELTPDPKWEVSSNQWATSVDQMRACIARDQPITIGVNWYSNFDSPMRIGPDYFVGKSSQGLGTIRGGHCVCLYGASDRRQAFKLKNSWGRDYPLVWLPYSVMERLLAEDGEATVVTDSIL